MCHQSVGLIARHVEALGIATLSMSSAWSITRAANPPRAAFLDFPLGHTSGRPDDPAGNAAILRDALRVFEHATTPGQIVMLDYEWAADDAWKDRVMRPRPQAADDAAGGQAEDDRVERFATPQYQCEADAALADAAGACPTCVETAPARRS